MLSDLMKTIWSTANQNNIHLSARHLAGSLNIRADELSCQVAPQDWFLNRNTFGTLDRMWGPHTIDRFASEVNAQLPVYNSRFWDPHTSGIDVIMQCNWKQHNNFVTPPFAMIPKVLSTVQAQEAHATLIAPAWRNQCWYTVLREMSVSLLFRIENSVRNVISQIPHAFRVIPNH